MTEKIEWDEKYSVDVPELDNYQKEIFDKFNSLIDMRAEKKNDPKAIINMVSDLNDYIKMFFVQEERMLKKKGYPDLEAHSKSHRQYLKSSIGLRREIAEDIENLTMEIILEMRGWMIEHIETSDSLYVPFIRIHQYIEDCKK